MAQQYRTSIALGVLLALVVAGYSIAGTGPQVIITKHTETVDSYELDLDYPELTGVTNIALQNEINDRLKRDIDAFAAELIPQAIRFFSEVEGDGFRPFPYQIQTKTQINTLTDKLMSITIYYYQYTGGAHGFTDKRTYNYDLREGYELELKDLFAPNTDYVRLVTEQIKDQIGDSPDYWEFETIAPNQPFYIKDRQVFVYFGLYEIAPYVAGFPEFPITIEVMSD